VTQTGRRYLTGIRLYHLVENYRHIQIKMLRQSPAQMEVLRTGLTKHPRTGIEEWARLGAQHADRASDLQLKVDDVPTVTIYHQYLKKIVEELVDNAFKFSGAGTPVEVAAAVEDGCYVVRVCDQGTGMTPQQIERVAAYAQFDRKVREQQGVGLGLVIARQLAELHSGQLLIDSTPNQGTMVRFVLPMT
jgi:signal transduction histidine kinase